MMRKTAPIWTPSAITIGTVNAPNTPPTAVPSDSINGAQLFGVHHGDRRTGEQGVQLVGHGQFFRRTVGEDGCHADGQQGPCRQGAGLLLTMCSGGSGSIRTTASLSSS